MIKEKTNRARELRQKSTKAEKRIWRLLRNRQFKGLKFLRQFPIVYNQGKTQQMFITDLYCSELKLIIEIDGKVHEKRQGYDEARTEILTAKGYKVVRIKNEEILTDEKKLTQKLNELLPSLNLERVGPKDRGELGKGKARQP